MRARRIRNPILKLLVITALILGAVDVAFASGVNTDVALTPQAHGGILRVRLMLDAADLEPEGRDVDTLAVTSTLVYGIRSDLALFLTTPFVNRHTDNGRGTSSETHTGLADLTALIKYRFIQRDTTAINTYRWALLAGLNIRSGDSDFTSDSYDPLAGLVFTIRRGRSQYDGDFIYQLNTGGGRHADDEFRYDFAFTHRLYPEEFKPGKARELDFVAELNGSMTTGGAQEVFVGPGLQFHLTRWVFEASVQLPVIQDLPSGLPETDYRATVGFHYHF